MKLRSVFQTVMEKSAKHSAAGLLSSAAAALNLWSGITMVIFVEIFEMCYRSVKSCRQRRKSENSETKTKTEESI